MEGTVGNIAVFAGEVADLAIRRILIVAWGFLAANVGVKMSFGAGAVAISRYGLVVNVVDWLNTRCEPRTSRGTRKKKTMEPKDYILKGPSSADGNPYRLMLKLTPVPLLADVPAT